MRRKKKSLSGNTHSMAWSGVPGYGTCHDCQSTFNDEHPDDRKIHETKAVHIVTAAKIKMAAQGFEKVQGFHECIKRAKPELLVRELGLVHPATGKATQTYYAPKWVVAIAANRHIRVTARTAIIKHFDERPDLQIEMVVREAFDEKLALWLEYLALVPESDFWDRAYLAEIKRLRQARLNKPNGSVIVP
jgi:hypothetical protein